MTRSDTARFTLDPRGPFDLDAARGMQCGFLRGTRRCDAARDTVRLAFPRDDGFDVVGVSLRYDGARIAGEVVGASDGDAIGAQVARVLGVDCDAAAFYRLLDADPALRPLGQARPGFRPVVAYSPYVMGAWAILSQRLRMDQAATLQVRIAEAAGDVVTVGDAPLASFPRPESLLRWSGFAGVPPEKWARLQALARAALRGELDLARLRATPYAEARARLMEIHGVGPWTADAILIRGCGPTDLLPLSEPALHTAVAQAYGLRGEPDDATVAAIAERWRPFRTWVSVLLISHGFRAAAGRSFSPRPRGRRVAAAAVT
jgi:DNA-3-methyladenine glycosylase II